MTGAGKENPKHLSPFKNVYLHLIFVKNERRVSLARAMCFLPCEVVGTLSLQGGSRAAVRAGAGGQAHVLPAPSW